METTVASPAVIGKETLETLFQTETERFTIVHCRLFVGGFETVYRIWKTTYLVEDKGRRAKLLHAFDISFYPEWCYAEPKNGSVYFTLVFEALSKGCASFHLLEDIPVSGGFVSAVTERNATDVYTIEVKTS